VMDEKLWNFFPPMARFNWKNLGKMVINHQTWGPIKLQRNSRHNGLAAPTLLAAQQLDPKWQKNITALLGKYLIFACVPRSLLGREREIYTHRYRLYV
jgi:hypothetical protein